MSDEILHAGDCVCDKCNAKWEQMGKIPNPIRRKCIECGVMHAMVVENKITGECTPINVCQDCMFKFVPITEQVQLTCDNVPEDSEEIQRQLGKKLLDILNNAWLKEVPKLIEDEGLVSEFGSVGNIRWPTADNVKMYDSDGNEMICKCGKPATCGIAGRNSYLAQCSDCFNAPKSDEVKAHELQIEYNMRRSKMLEKMDSEIMGTSPVKDAYFMLQKAEDEQLSEFLKQTACPVIHDCSPTVMHPRDCYEMFKKNPQVCEDLFGIENVKQIDYLVKRLYIEDSWPDHIKRGEELDGREPTWELEQDK